MGAVTEIAWATHTFNPWWGCTKVSSGCKNCYAETLSNRFSPGIWGKGAPRRRFGPRHWEEPVAWNRKAERSGTRPTVFCASMADVFDPDAPEFDRDQLWDLIWRTQSLDWLILTRRPENIPLMIPPAWWEKPRPNVWWGTSIEDQESADERVPLLLQVPAEVRFLSCEPLLGPLNLTEALAGQNLTPYLEPRKRGVDWVLLGGESGRGARPCRIEWIEDAMRQCIDAEVRIFVKQMGSNLCEDLDPNLAGESFLDRMPLKNMRRLFRNAKGGDPAEWPKHLRVREFPR